MAKAVVATAYGGPEVLSIIGRAVEEPGPGEVTIEVKAAGVNPIDYKLYSGAFGDDPDSLPMGLGNEAAGVVTAAGSDATGAGGPVEVGDEVIAFHPGVSVSGLYASEATVPAEMLVPKPAELGWEEAAGLMLVGATAVHTLEATGVGRGDWVLIHGVSGGVGLTAAQLAILRGASVVGTAGESRHEKLRGYGIEPVTYGDGLADRVREQAPDAIDAAIDAVGTDEAIDTSLELVSDRERIATIAAFQRAGDEGIKALGGAGDGVDPGTELRISARTELVDLAAEGKLDLIIAETFPLADAAAAHELVAAGHAGGKVVLIP